MALTHPCAATVFGDRVQSWGCTRAGVIERKGKWYCKQHDPEQIKARRAAQDASWKRTQAAGEVLAHQAQTLADQLGVEASCYYRIGASLSRSGYQRALIISFEECERLLARLK